MQNLKHYNDEKTHLISDTLTVNCTITNNVSNNLAK